MAIKELQITSLYYVGVELLSQAAPDLNCAFSTSLVLSFTILMPEFTGTGNGTSTGYV